MHPHAHAHTKPQTNNDTSTTIASAALGDHDGAPRPYYETSFLVKILGLYSVNFSTSSHESSFRIVAMENLSYAKGSLEHDAQVQVRLQCCRHHSRQRRRRRRRRQQ
jgi:hypothetical protein